MPQLNLEQSATLMCFCLAFRTDAPSSRYLLLSKVRPSPLGPGAPSSQLLLCRRNRLFNFYVELILHLISLLPEGPAIFLDSSCAVFSCASCADATSHLTSAIAVISFMSMSCWLCINFFIRRSIFSFTIVGCSSQPVHTRDLEWITTHHTILFIPYITCHIHMGAYFLANSLHSNTRKIYNPKGAEKGKEKNWWRSRNSVAKAKTN